MNEVQVEAVKMIPAAPLCTRALCACVVRRVSLRPPSLLSARMRECVNVCMLFGAWVDARVPDCVAGPQELRPQHDQRSVAGGHRCAGEWDEGAGKVPMECFGEHAGWPVLEVLGTALRGSASLPVRWMNCMLKRMSELTPGAQALLHCSSQCPRLPSPAPHGPVLAPPPCQVIAARKGEFETGFERGGQTREHAQLAKTLGVSKLIVVVNKMDDPSVKWSKERWGEEARGGRGSGREVQREGGREGGEGAGLVSREAWDPAVMGYFKEP